MYETQKEKKTEQVGGKDVKLRKQNLGQKVRNYDFTWWRRVARKVEEELKRTLQLGFFSRNFQFIEVNIRIIGVNT